MDMNNYLSENELIDVLASLDGDVIEFDRVRPHNKGEIRKTESMPLNELKSFILEALEEGHQPGGDIEIKVPQLNKILVGMHDGIYWLE